MNSLRFLHLLLGQAALVAGLIGSLPFFAESGPIDLAAVLLIFFGLLNLQRFGSLRLPTAPIRSALLIAGSLLLSLATLIPLAAFLVTPAAAGLVVYAVGLAIASVCLTAVVEMLGWLPPARSSRRSSGTAAGDRETGTVKWFNTTKGFGFISRDAGDDIFVHFRGIRGDGHRALLEGQRVEFVVTQREKGPQAEDVVIID